ADLVCRLDKGPPDVMVTDYPQLEGQARFLGVADGRRHTRIGHRDDDIRIDVALPRELHADALARLVDARPFDDAVGPREIDVLEDAEPAVALPKRHNAANPSRPDDDDLPGFDVALEFGADDVERAALGSEDPGIAKPAEDQRPHAERIAHA